MSEIKQLFNQTLIYGFSSVVARILNFFLVPLYTILFMPSEYAIVAEMYAYAALFMVIGSFGMETGFFRFVKDKNIVDQYSIDSVSKVFSSSFTFLFINAFIIVFLGLCFYQNIADTIGYGNYPQFVLYFLFIIGLDLISVIPFALLRQQNKAIKFASIKTFNIAINIFFNLFFLLLCPYLQDNGFMVEFVNSIYNPSISVGYVFISNLIASIITLLILLPEIKANMSKPDFSIFKRMIRYSWPILIAGLAFIINETIDKLLLKYLLQPKYGTVIAMNQLGIYSACYKLTIFMTLFVQAYRFAAEPFFFSQFKKPNAKIIYSLMMQIFVLVALSIFLFVVLYIDVIKFIIPAEEYHKGISIIPIVLMANICLGIYYNLSVWYKVTNKTRYAAIISTIGALLTLALNIVFIPIYGYMAAAWTTLVCYGSMMMISFYFGQVHFKIPYKIKSILIYFGLALGIVLFSTFIDVKMYNNIQIDNTVLFMLYIIFMYSQIKKLFKPITIK